MWLSLYVMFVYSTRGPTTTTPHSPTRSLMSSTRRVELRSHSGRYVITASILVFTHSILNAGSITSTAHRLTGRRLKVKGKVWYSCSWYTISQLRSVTCHMGSRSVTCHPTQVSTPRLHPGQSGRYSIYLPRRDGRLSWPRWLVTYRDGLTARRRSPIQVLTRPGVD